jgi:hypothetical protein
MITSFEVSARPRRRRAEMLKQVNPKVLADVRFCAHTGLIADMAPCPFCAINGLMQCNRQRERHERSGGRNLHRRAGAD